MIIQVEGNKKAIEDSLSSLFQLPKAIKPIYFTDAEGTIDKENDICANKVRFDNFIKENPLGFMLYGEASTIDVRFSDNSVSSIFIEIRRKSAYKHAEVALNHLSRAGIYFGFAGSWEERKHRNGILKDFGSYTLEWWVGRDVNKYIPGLYWLTVIPLATLEHYNLKETEFEQINASVYKIPESSCLMVKAYDQPQDWEEFKEDIDDFCYKTRGFFSRRKIQSDLDSIVDRDEYDQFTDKWR